MGKMKELVMLKENNYCLPSREEVENSVWNKIKIVNSRKTLEESIVHYWVDACKQ